MYVHTYICLIILKSYAYKNRIEIYIYTRIHYTCTYLYICMCYKRNTNDDDDEKEEEEVLMSEYENKRKQRIAENKRKFDEYWRSKHDQPPATNVAKKRKVDANKLKVCNYTSIRTYNTYM